MGRRIRWLGVVLLLCFAAVVIQLVNIQYAKAPQLRASPYNPRNAAKNDYNFRGNIYASDGTLLAKSVKAASGSLDYTREYPGGSLYSQIVGFDSTYEGTAGVEYEYNSQLESHQLPAQNLSQALGLDSPPRTTDNITLTIEPGLQAAAQAALSHLTGPNTDAGVVAIDPSTGAILADYSTPSFDPAPLEAPDTTAGTNEQEFAALSYFKTEDHEGFYAGVPLATYNTFFPGSTFKVVTSSAVYNLDPSLSNFYFPYATSTMFPNSTAVLHNDGGSSCGGTMTQMLPASCDPGYAQLGVKLGATDLAEQAALFGYNSQPPIDLPSSWVATPYFAPASQLMPPNQAILGYSAIGQEDDKASVLSNALVAAGIADKGAIMTPHVLQQITNYQGEAVSTYEPTVWKQAESPSAAAQVTALMKLVVTEGTADMVGLSPSLDAAVKTGTAQVGDNLLNDTDDWMIGFAPASDPTIAVAVVVPLQAYSATGALVAGPIMKDMLDAALLAQG
jgi:peptidoglycan glycosyltransferase